MLLLFTDQRPLCQQQLASDGGFNRSLQHPSAMEVSNDKIGSTEVSAEYARATPVAWASASRSARRSHGVLGGDSAWPLSHCRGRACAGVVGGGARWFRQAGGMPPTHVSPSARLPTGRYLAFAEREQRALLRAQGHGVRECARHLGRSPSTVSRELRRNAATRSGALDYTASTAQCRADRAALRPKVAWRRTLRFVSLYRIASPG